LVRDPDDLRALFRRSTRDLDLTSGLYRETAGAMNVLGVSIGKPELPELVDDECRDNRRSAGHFEELLGVDDTLDAVPTGKGGPRGED
jgi:hypothetical protein